jgi:hypothetical protein
MEALLGHWLPMGMPRETSLRERIEYGREFLRCITLQDFEYDAMKWHEYLWESKAGGYRRSRRSPKKWIRHVQAAIAVPEWQQAVLQLRASDESQSASDRGRVR